MAKPAFKFEVGTENSGGDGVVIEVNPDHDDDGDDFTLTVRIKRPKPYKPRPNLQVVSKQSALVEDEDTSGAEAWYAHMLS